MMAALDDDICNEVLNTKVYQSTATNVNPEGITISNWFLRRIEDKDIGGTIGGAKTGYVDESGSCAVSSMTSDSGTNYICCTAKSSSSWQCIYDHVAIYKNYTK
jgi:D-alanyl-D-alanine carboxypeptidase (penicillin-binding protein 5/6)